MTFKELLNQCSWEDLEDFLYEFPDVGMDEGRWKMEGFRRMYDELRRMTPQASEQKIQLRKPKEKGCDYPALFTRPAANSGYLSACSWAEYLGQEVVPPKGMKLPPAALVAACMCAIPKLGYTEQECEETYNQIVEHTAESPIVKYDLYLKIYNNLPLSLHNSTRQRKLRDRIWGNYYNAILTTTDDLTTMSQIYKISIGGSGWDDLLDDFPRQLEMIPKQLCKCRKYWIIINYMDLVLRKIIRKFLQTWIENHLPPQVEIFQIIYESRLEWGRSCSLPSNYVTIIAGK